MRRREVWIAAALAAAVAAWIWWRAPAPAHSDFCSYYAAGHLVRDGRPAAAYDAAELERAHRAIHDVGRRAGPFLYSPLLLAPSAAFAAAPLPAAAAVNRALGAAALGAGLLLLLAALPGPGERLAFAAAFVLAHAVSVQLLYENWTTILFALLAGAALALRRDRPLAAGLLAAGAVHLKAFSLFAFAPLAAGRRRPALGWALAAGLVLAAGALPLTGIEPWRRFAAQLAGAGGAGVTPYYNKCSLAANLARLSAEPREWVSARAPVESLPVRAAFWAGLPLAAWGAWRLRRAPEAAFAFGLAWTLLFVPQIWEHTELLLFVALPALAPRWRWLALVLLAATFFYAVVQQELLREVLAGARPAASLAALLLLYPSLNLLVLAAALASGGPQARAGSRARAA